MALFENYERRIDKINGVLAQYGISSVEECREICKAKGFDPYEIVKGIQPICFENACWAYTVGAAIAIKSGVKSAAEAAKMIGVGLQSFCIDGSVAEDRKVGLGHGNLGAMLLSDESKCFAFLAGHESFAAAEGAIGIVKNANKARKEPLRVILNGLGKDAAQIISRINGFTYVQTQFDYFTGKLNVVREIRYSEGERANVRCYGADDVREGVAIMHAEGVDVSITGNSTNPTRFQHPVAGTYKKECIEQGKKYFSVASGGGTGRTLHPDNMAAGPASYGMTDTMGRMHSDAQFAGSSSVPAHVEMMGFLGMGNNPMVGATVAVAVAVQIVQRELFKQIVCALDLFRKDCFCKKSLRFFIQIKLHAAVKYAGKHACLLPRARDGPRVAHLPIRAPVCARDVRLHLLLRFLFRRRAGSAQQHRYRQQPHCRPFPESFHDPFSPSCSNSFVL